MAKAFTAARIRREGALLCANVKKVPNNWFQGLDPGEILFGDFPFQIWKSLK
jgi:hypothetical protein